ncbi:MAG: Uma2 family endonuclease [Bacteroidota bacterium]
MDTSQRILEMLDFDEQVMSYANLRGKPVPSLNHAILQKRILVELDNNYRKDYEILPEIRINDIEKERCADILICDSRVTFKPIYDVEKLETIPFGSIEILTYGELLSDLVDKSDQYFKVGVKSYWLVLPDLRSIYVFDRPQNYQVFTWRDQLKDEVLDIELNLGEIFK